MSVHVSIDLLPQSRKIKIDKMPLLLLSGAVVLLLALFLLVSFFMARNSVTVLNETIVTQTEVSTQLQDEYILKTRGVTEYNFADTYTSLTGFMDGIYLDPLAIQKNVYDLLPAASVIDNYAFTNDGALTMTITFSSKGDAATYLNELLLSDFVNSAEVDTISIDEESKRFVSAFRINLVTLEGDAQ